MTAPFSHTQRPVRLTVWLETKPRKGAPPTGPSARTVVIPQDGSVQIGRASTSSTKNRRPAADNALFECAVMSRCHAAISAPNGPYGSLVLEDVGSLHGVYVNGRKITRTEIFPFDKIRFGSQVTRAEAIHDGVDVQIVKIVRSGALFSNPSTTNTLPETSKTVFEPSYRVPDYDTDSSKDDLICTTSIEPSVSVKPAAPVDLDPVSSPAYAHSLGESLEFSHDNSDEDSELDSQFDEGHDYPDNPDELDVDDDSQAASDRSESPGLSELSDDLHDASEEEDSLDDESFETQFGTLPMSPLLAPTESKVTGSDHQTQAQKTDKPRDAAEEVMSIPWLVEPTLTIASHEWYYPNIPMAPNSITPKIPSVPSQKDAMLAVFEDDTLSTSYGDTKKDSEVKAIQNADDFPVNDRVLKEKVAESQPAQATAISATAAESVVADEKVAAPALTAAELFHKVDSPAGSKRKRDADDDGHEETTASSTARRLFKFRLGPQHKNALTKLLPKPVNVKEAPRPMKRAKRSTAQVALSAFAGALGGMATVVGVLMTPQCEQLLANWPIQ